jgi:hypothetical protein
LDTCFVAAGCASAKPGARTVTTIAAMEEEFIALQDIAAGAGRQPDDTDDIVHRRDRLISRHSAFPVGL